jgi:DNA-binding NarL/FixJ family response regulator
MSGNDTPIAGADTHRRRLSDRTAIRAILDLPSFQVCGEAKNGKEASEKVIESQPDIVLLDINMPVLNGVKAATEIRRVSANTKIVFLTNHDTPAFRDAALRLESASVNPGFIFVGLRCKRRLQPR